MPGCIRLVAIPTADPQTVRFCAAFASPAPGDTPRMASAWLETGEGPALALGLLAAPSSTTWRRQRLAALATHTYLGTGPFTARLLWDDELVETRVRPQTTAEPARAGQLVQLIEFKIEGDGGRALEQSFCWTVRGLAPGEILRLDGGAGQTHIFTADASGECVGECRLTSAKPGSYLAALDLLDSDGFWLATLAEYPLELAGAEESAGWSPPALPGATGHQPIADEPVQGRGEPKPWVPGRYVRPLWGWVRSYDSPGAASVTRVLASGTYLSLRGESLIGDSLWYQTAALDWVSAVTVEEVLPSQLRGVELTTESPGVGQPGWPIGTVTVDSLNVRPQPGLLAANAPCQQLSRGTSVTIYEEVIHGGARWYRIGPRRWVHADNVRVPALMRPVHGGNDSELRPAPLQTGAARHQADATENVSAPSGGAPRLGPNRPQVLPLGWVIATALNLRLQPGIAEANPPVARVEHNQVLPILESHLLGGTPWYRVGPESWVEGAWVAPARPIGRPVGIAGHEHWVAVSLTDQTLVAYEGDRAVYAAMVATGRNGMPTPAGLFRVGERADCERMSGGSPARGSSYDLEDVPWVQHFFGSYALHGAYWHDGFGRPRSHGCVNLSLYDAWWLYKWAVDVVFIY